MKNCITLEIGGKARVLEFNFGTLEHIKNITGVDPLQFTVDTEDYESVKTGAAILIEAGLKTHDEQAEFSLDWVKKIPISHLLKVFNTWGASKRIDTSGEVEADTQS